MTSLKYTELKPCQTKHKQILKVKLCRLNSTRSKHSTVTVLNKYMIYGSIDIRRLVEWAKSSFQVHSPLPYIFTNTYMSICWFIVSICYLLTSVAVHWMLSRASNCNTIITWWRHQMETFSTLPVTGEFPPPPKAQWRVTLMFSLTCASTNGWANNREAGDLRRYGAHYDVIVMTRNYRYNIHWGNIQYPHEIGTRLFVVAIF